MTIFLGRACRIPGPVRAMPPVAIAAGLLLAGGAAGALANSGGNGKIFLALAIRYDIAEIEGGQLAQQKAQDAAVRRYGRMLAADETQARTEQTAMANSLHYKVPLKAGSEDRHEFKKLSGLSGTAFDQEFVKAMVDARQTAVAVFEMEARRGDPQVSDLAHRELPTEQQHLDLAEALLARIGQPAAQ